MNICDPMAVPSRAFRKAVLGLVLCTIGAMPAVAKDRIADPAESHARAEKNLSAPHPVVYDAVDLDTMIGQMVMVGFHGTSAKRKTVRNIAKLIKDGTIGGVILMARNVKNKKQLRNLTTLFHEARPKLPPFISIDQEGGVVQRLSKRRGFRSTPAAAYVVQKKTVSQARELYAKMAEELADVGINMNFGPVVDLATNKRNPIITRRGRSYGKDPKTVVDFASAFIEAHRDHGILSVAKHFPGHGSSWTDSHRRFVDLSKTWKPVELEPYRLLSGEKAPDLVMVGHLYHPKYGGKAKLPASLSDVAIETELRKGLQFGGLVITDDLEMKPVKRRYKRPELIARAINAGNDIVLFSDATKAHHTPRLVHKYIKQAVERGQISRKRIETSYRRIVAAKKAMMSRWRKLRSHAAELETKSKLKKDL